MSVAAEAVLCPVVVGREAELAMLADRLERARAGRGSVVALIGEPGIGKTRLARETQAVAAGAGSTVLRGRCSPGVPAPFAALVDALAPALRARERHPEIASLRPALGTMIDGGARSPEPSTPVVRDAVADALRILAEPGGSLLVLEDIHWADADTLGVLDHLGDQIAALRVLCLVTLRDDPGPALDLVERMAARRAAERITLTRLDAGSAAEMVRRSLETREVPATVVEEVITRAEGVPFVVEELLTAYLSNYDVRTLPHTYRELVRARLASVDDDTRRTLFAAAIVGRRFEWSLLSSIAGLDRDGVMAALRIAVQQKLVTSDPAPGLEMPFAFRHALVRDALLGELLPPESAALAARAADAIEERDPALPGDRCERVADLRELAGDPAATARLLQEAARRAFLRGALASAEAVLERARLLVFADRWHRIGIDRQLVEVLSAAGKVERLREIGDDALAFVIEKRSAMPFVVLGLGYLHLRLARGLASAGLDDAADEHLSRARVVADETGDEKLRARVHASRAARALDRGDAGTALTLAGEAAAAGETLHLKDVRSEALAIQGRAAERSGDVESATASYTLARDEAGDDTVARMAALLDLGRLQAHVSGDLAGLDSARALAAASGAVSTEARALLWIAGSLIERFKLADATPLVSTARDITQRYGLAMLADAHALDAEIRVLTAPEADVDRATSNLERPERAHLVLALRLEDRALALRAAAALPSDPVARAVGELLSALEGRTAARTPTVDRLATAIAHATATSSIDDAGRELAAFPWWHEVIVRLLVERAVGLGAVESATRLLRSIPFFEGAGHERLASACKALLRAAGIPVPRKGRGDSSVPAALRDASVTSREMDVLRLVGRGLGNAEIATHLFLSRRTVETHVASLQRKLQLRSRSDLAMTAKSLDASVEPKGT